MTVLPTGGWHDSHVRRRGICAAHAGVYCGRPCVDREAYMVRAGARFAEEECGARPEARAGYYCFR